MWFDWSAPQTGAAYPFAAGWPSSSWPAANWPSAGWAAPASQEPLANEAPPIADWWVPFAQNSVLTAGPWQFFAPALWSAPFATASSALSAPSAQGAAGEPPAEAAAKLPRFFAEAAERTLQAGAPEALAKHFKRQLPTLRSAFDAFFYPVDRLTATDRDILRRAFPPGEGAHAVIAVRARSLRVYEGLDDLVAANDALARVAAVVPPGVGALGAAAFAREIATAIGEPVLTVAPSYDAADAFAEMLGMVSMSAGRRDGADDLRPEAKTLLGLLDGRAANAKLVIAHGGGAFVAAEMLDALGEGAARGDAARRLISFGAAPHTPHGCDAFSIVGAADPYGWLFVEPEAWVYEAPFATGHHFNRAILGAIELRRHLADIETSSPFLTAPSRPRPMRGPPMAAVVAD